MIILRQKEFTRAEKEAMFQLMRLTKGFKSLPKELNSVENAKRFKKFSNRLVKFANDPEAHKFTAEELKEMKGFLNDIGATKFADNFEPIVNKYYGNNNIDAWKRLTLKETRMPRKELVSRHNRLVRRYNDASNTNAEATSYLNAEKSTKGKSSKEIFSSPEGKLIKNIIKGETGGVGQPSVIFNNAKGRDKMANLNVKESNLTGAAKKEFLKEEKTALRGNQSFISHGGKRWGDINSYYGNVFLSRANPAALSHELGHSKSLVDSIAARTAHKEKIYSPEKLRKARLDCSISTEQRAKAIYGRLNDLGVIAEENMANAHGRDIIRKYGGKNVDKYLADYDKMVDNINMKSYLSGARFGDVDTNLDMTGRIIDINGWRW